MDTGDLQHGGVEGRLTEEVSVIGDHNEGKAQPGVCLVDVGVEGGLLLGGAGRLLCLIGGGAIRVIHQGSAGLFGELVGVGAVPGNSGMCDQPERLCSMRPRTAARETGFP